MVGQSSVYSAAPIIAAQNSKADRDLQREQGRINQIIAALGLLGSNISKNREITANNAYQDRVLKQRETEAESLADYRKASLANDTARTTALTQSSVAKKALADDVASGKITTGSPDFKTRIMAIKIMELRYDNAHSMQKMDQEIENASHVNGGDGMLGNIPVEVDAAAGLGAGPAPKEAPSAGDSVETFDDDGLSMVIPKDNPFTKAYGSSDPNKQTQLAVAWGRMRRRNGLPISLSAEEYSIYHNPQIERIR